MEGRNGKAKYIRIMAGLLCALLAVGCAGSRSLTRMYEDITDEGHEIETALFWRVEVIDRTSTLKSSPRFYIYHPEETKPGDAWHGDLVREFERATGDWKMKNNASYLEDIVVAESASSQYLFKEVDLYLYTKTYSNQWRIARSESREVYFTGSIDRACTIPPEKLAYLGVITIEFTGMKGERYLYRTRFSQDREDFDKDVKLLRERYPVLSEQFDQRIDAARCNLVFIEDFKNNIHRWPTNIKRRHSTARINRGTLTMQSKNNACHREVIRPSFEMPGNFDIELVSRWKEGVDDRGYGLALGRDRRNGYGFHVSADGSSNVGLFKKKKHQHDLVAWKSGTATRGDGKSMNRQKVAVRGDRLTYYVNGAIVGEMVKDMDIEEWAVGVTVCGKQEVAFDQLTIVER